MSDKAVAGHKDLVKNTSNGLVKNKNHKAYLAAVSRKEKIKTSEDEVSQLKKQVELLTKMVETLQTSQLDSK